MIDRLSGSKRPVLTGAYLNAHPEPSDRDSELLIFDAMRDAYSSRVQIIALTSHNQLREICRLSLFRTVVVLDTANSDSARSYPACLGTYSSHFLTSSVSVHKSPVVSLALLGRSPPC